jgi:hypothetical protein
MKRILSCGKFAFIALVTRAHLILDSCHKCISLFKNKTFDSGGNFFEPTVPPTCILPCDAVYSYRN